MKNLWQKLLSPQVGEQFRERVWLGFRVLLAWSMIHTHGLKKLLDFEGTLHHIPDPIGMGAYPSAVLAVFINIVSAGLVGMGLLTRFNALLILSLTLMGLFVVHASDPWPVRDVPFMYSLAFGLVLFWGGGKYSLDALLYANLKTPKN